MKIGVIIPIEEWEGGGVDPVLPWSRIKELVLQADAATFDSIWTTGDHLIYRPGEPAMPWMTQTQGVWEGWTMLTAFAAITERVEIGSWVMCGPFRNPALLAKMASTLDEVSGGRLILGLGAGWHQAEFTEFDFPFDHRVDRFEEMLQIVVPLLRAGKVDFQGTYYRAQCELVPRGPRLHGPPILIGAQQPRMLRLTAKYADSWHGSGDGDPTAFLKACDEVGRDPATVELTRTVAICYPDLGRVPTWAADANTGTNALIAQLRTCQDSGIGHVQCQFHPRTPESLARVADGISEFRRG